MEEWKRLEFDYSKRLRESSDSIRRQLYSEAYSAVSKLAVKRFTTNKSENRTAGTSKALLHLLSQMLNKNDIVLEVGCGRGYTCLFLVPYVKSIIGTDVSEMSLKEASDILSKNNQENASIENVAAFELIKNFKTNQFTCVISIALVEHLHPEDAEEHFRQVFNILKPGGKYIVVMPNRLNGPHDITKDEFPESKEALGFHLNESTYGEMTRIMRNIGYHKFQSFHPLRLNNDKIKTFRLPYQLNIIFEFLYKIMHKIYCIKLLEKTIFIRLIAYKP